MRSYYLVLLCCLAACCLEGCGNGASTKADNRGPEWSLVLRQGTTWAVQIDSNDTVLLPENSAHGQWRTNGISRESVESITIPVLSEFVEVTITNSRRHDGLQLLLDGERLYFPRWEKPTNDVFGTEAYRLPLRPRVGRVHTLKVKHGSERHAGERDYLIEVVASVRKESPLFYPVTPNAYVLATGNSRPTNILVFTNCGGQSFLAERHMQWGDLEPFTNAATAYRVLDGHLPAAPTATNWVTNTRSYAVQAYLRWLKETTLAPGVFRFQNSAEAIANVSTNLLSNRSEAVSDPVPLWHEQDAVYLLQFTNNLAPNKIAAPVNFPSATSAGNVYFRICYDQGPLRSSGTDASQGPSGPSRYGRAIGD